jgi:putative redox protein
MGSSLQVTAEWQGGLSAIASARGHEIVADEPVASGGADLGMMPTELLCAGLASCFCLAVAHVAAKRGISLPGLRVTVDAEREGSELRYGRLRVEVAAVVAQERLAGLVDRARRFCWVSNMLAPDIDVRYIPIALTDTENHTTTGAA